MDNHACRPELMLCHMLNALMHADDVESLVTLCLSSHIRLCCCGFQKIFILPCVKGGCQYSLFCEKGLSPGYSTFRDMLTLPGSFNSQQVAGHRGGVTCLLHCRHSGGPLSNERMNALISTGQPKDNSFAGHDRAMEAAWLSHHCGGKL